MTHSIIVSAAYHLDKATMIDFDKAAMVEMFEEIYDSAMRSAHEGKAIHETEKKLHADLQKLGLGILKAFVKEVGPGDLGDTIELNDATILKRLSQMRTRRYVSLVGELNIERYVYAQRESQKIEFVPTDARLNLPQSEYSYPIQDFAQKLAVEMSYANVVATVQNLLHVRLTVAALERSNRNMSEYVENFRNTRPCPTEEAEILVSQADGKGVPIIPEQTASKQTSSEHFGEKKSGPSVS